MWYVTVDKWLLVQIEFVVYDLYILTEDIEALNPDVGVMSTDASNNLYTLIIHSEEYAIAAHYIASVS